MKTFARTDRSPLGEWWWTVDRWSIVALLALICMGAILSFAASPAVAVRIGQSSMHFVTRQFLFLIPAVAVLFATSLLAPRGVRRVAFVLLGVGLVMLVLTLFVGADIKGARRWLGIGSFAIQPSEFVKPAFIVAVAWVFAEGGRHSRALGFALGALLYVMVAGLFVLEPDFGQTLLVSLTFAALVFLAGVSWLWIAGIAVAGLGGAVLAYVSVPHVASRVDRFLDPASGDTFQVDKAKEAIIHGGLTGVGPGEGIVKRVIPDAHTDFVFSVAAEEYGLILGLVLIGLFGFVVVRGLARAFSEEDQFVQLAASGLFILFGLQAFVNIGVNVTLLPAKGMTLPFISYGGSSLVALALAMGMALALTRRRPSLRLLQEYRA